MDAVLTVVIPVYNGEKYIARAVNSILEQPEGNRTEVLIVNDGSQDATKSICDDLAEKHANVHVIHKENSGVALSRNLGIEHVTTKYTAFLDCDDWWENGFLDADIVREFEKDDSADVYQFAFQLIDYYGILKKVCPVQGDVVRYTERGLRPYDWAHHCSFVYRTELLHENKVIYPDCKIGEDGHFVEMALFHAIIIKKINKVIFNYWQRTSSCLHTTPKMVEIIEIYKGGQKTQAYFAEYGVFFNIDTSLIWMIANGLPRLCATYGYEDCQQFMEEYCFRKIAQHPAIRIEKTLWKRVEAWRKSPLKYWIKSRIVTGALLHMKEFLSVVPGINILVNYIYFRFLRGFTPVKL